jgi:hypothetical protein
MSRGEPWTTDRSWASSLMPVLAVLVVAALVTAALATSQARADTAIVTGERVPGSETDLWLTFEVRHECAESCVWFAESTVYPVSHGCPQTRNLADTIWIGEIPPSGSGVEHERKLLSLPKNSGNEVVLCFFVLDRSWTFIGSSVLNIQTLPIGSIPPHFPVHRGRNCGVIKSGGGLSLLVVVPHSQLGCSAARAVARSFSHGLERRAPHGWNCRSAKPPGDFLCSDKRNRSVETIWPDNE